MAINHTYALLQFFPWGLRCVILAYKLQPEVSKRRKNRQVNTHLQRRETGAAPAPLFLFSLLRRQLALRGMQGCYQDAWPICL